MNPFAMTSHITCSSKVFLTLGTDKWSGSGMNALMDFEVTRSLELHGTCIAMMFLDFSLVVLHCSKLSSCVTRTSSLIVAVFEGGGGVLVIVLGSCWRT